MRIGIEAQRIFRPKKHGMDIVALEMIRHLQQIDHTNEYFIFVKNDKDVCLEETPNFKIVILPGFNYAFWEQVILPKVTEKYALDILHCTSNTAPVSVKTKLILTLHDIIYMEKSNRLSQYKSWYQKLGKLYRKWNVPLIINKTQAIITVSDYENKRICDLFNLDEANVFTIHNGVSTKFNSHYPVHYYNEIKAKYHLPEKFLFFLGNKDPKKNLETTLMAYVQIYREVQIPLVIADIDRNYIEQILNLNMIDSSILKGIILPGYISNQDLPGIYGSCTVFLYTSLRESFGLPIVEAMACGAPVVASDTSSMPEIAGDAALFIDPSNKYSISMNVLKILKNPSLAMKLSEKGEERAKKFSWVNVAYKALAIYQKVYKGESVLQTY